MRREASLVTFGLIAVVAPLAFGSVDRLPQIALLVLLAVGILLQPPAVVPLSLWGNRLAIAFVGILVFKEFAPAAWFGDTLWRSSLTRAFALELPFTHHPEPSRALDAILSGVAGVVWFLWVRRLAAERENRPILVWMLFLAAAIVAIVSFVMRNPQGEAIFGLRYTPGWGGFGPFPNRNHSACYFAMAAVLGCGCLTWTALGKRWTLFALGSIPLTLIVIALLFTESRGGLIAFGFGLGCFLLLCVAKLRSGRAFGAAAGTALFFIALALAFGSQVLTRFQSEERGHVSNITRLSVWKDALGMWRDAPLLGHGVGSFESIFPLYQKIALENQVVLHPESSWLQWLTELGLIPVLLSVTAASLFLNQQVRQSFARHSSFFLRAGAFAAGAVLLCHALYDVPAHRWVIAGFALAVVAIACPMHLTGRPVAQPWQAALVPLGIAVFWSLPFYFNVPAWSPSSLGRLLTRDAVPGLVGIEEVQRGLRYFPLNPDLHQSLGLRLLRQHGRAAPETWQRHFGVAARLQPSVWDLSLVQARAVQRVAPSLALPFWQQAVERGGGHRAEVLGMAVQETAGQVAAQSAWGRYVEAHPDLLLTYAQLLTDSRGRYYYERWWKQRGQAAELTPAETRDFYLCAARWGTPEQLAKWTGRHPEWTARDYRPWATMLQHAGDFAGAWEILARAVPDPGWPAAAPNILREQLESRWRLTPGNFVNAQQLAVFLFKAGEVEASEEIILTVAARYDAPTWFIQKAAHILAQRGRTIDAVAILIPPE